MTQDLYHLCPSLQAVLRANQGAVHETIDQLLTMTTDTQSQGESVVDQLAPHTGGGGGGGGAINELPPSYALSATPPPSYHQAVPSPNRSPLLVCIPFVLFHSLLSTFFYLTYISYPFFSICIQETVNS